MTEEQAREMVAETERNRAELINERKELVEKFGWNNKAVRQYSKDIMALWRDIQNIKAAYNV